MSERPAIRLFDFDRTIYHGNASLDYYRYSIGQKPSLLKYLPYQLWHLTLHVVGAEDTTRFKSSFFIFLRGIKNPESHLDRFWRAHMRKIKPWYAQQDHNHDVVISASPEFLLGPACERLGVKLLLATRMDAHTGAIHGRNCRGEEKVRRLREVLPAATITEAYSDHLSDAPLLGLAKQPFLVIGHQVIPAETIASWSRAKLLRARFARRC